MAGGGIAGAIMAPLLLSLFAGGCGVVNFRNDGPGTTASVPKSVSQAGLAAGDVAALARSAAAATREEPGTAREWENAETGSSGTFAFVEAAGSQACRPFVSTVTSVSGVHGYRGIACVEDGGAAIQSLLPIRPG